METPVFRRAFTFESRGTVAEPTDTDRALGALGLFCNTMASSSSSAQRVDALAAQAFRLRIEGRPAEAATQYALALEALGHHSSMRSARADLLSDYGIALNQAGQREKAFDAYESCLALNPTHGQAYNNLAVALQEHGRGRSIH